MNSNPRRLASVLPWIVSLGLVATLAAATLQNRWKDEAKGTYRVVISRQLPAPGWKAGTLYTEFDVAAAFYNQIDRDGLVPIHIELFTEHDGEGRAYPPRLLVIAKPR